MRGRRLSAGRTARGIAEIVGTLMLIVIVITAAVLLAAFVATYEKAYLAQEAHNHLVSMESLRVVGVSSMLCSPAQAAASPAQCTAGGFAFLNFTIASGDVNPSSVTSITLNGDPLKQYEARDLDTGAFSNVTLGVASALNLTADEEATVFLQFAPAPAAGSTNFSFLAVSAEPAPSSYLTIDLYTFLGNRFEQSYLPPTAVAYVSTLTTYSDGTPEQVPVFIGTDSFQPGGNGTIVDWTWTIWSGGAPGSASGTFVQGGLYGAEVEPSYDFATGTPYYVELNVTSSDGLVGTTSVEYLASS